MKIFCIHNNTGSRYYRLIPQLTEMQKRGHKVILEPHNTPSIEKKIDWADLVIFQMVLSLDLVKYAKDTGKKVIFECDDLVHKVPKTHYAYKETKGLKGLELLWKMLTISWYADGFIAATPQLLKYAPFSKKLLFPNYCDLVHWLKEYRENQTKRVRLLYAGSTSHTGDLEWIKPVLKKVLNKYPNIQFIYVGTGGIKTNDLNARFIYGEDFFEGLPNNREAMLPVPPNVWPYILSSLMADMAIAPLEKNYFNKCKSQCKYLEYGINRIPAVYSRHHYTDVKDGKTGLLADTRDEWFEKICWLAEHEKERKQIGQNAYQDILKNYDIRKYIINWVNFAESL